MSCLDHSELARLATTGDDHPHVETCIDCRRALEQQRNVRAALAALPAPHADGEARRAIKAETMAAVAIDPVATKRSHLGVTATGTALAAVIAALVFTRGTTAEAPTVVLADSREAVASRVRVVAKEDAPALRAAPVVTARRGTTFTQTLGIDRDVIVLEDGALDMDTRDARGIDVHVGRAIVSIDNSVVTMRAHQYTITKIDVAIGAAHVVGPNQKLDIEQGSVWTSQQAPTAGASFRDAWIALRAGDNKAAIVLFDHTADPAFAEEASYWAAIAAKRAGDNADAKQRFGDFVARFPTSPYIEQARRAIAELP